MRMVHDKPVIELAIELAGTQEKLAAMFRDAGWPRVQQAHISRWLLRGAAPGEYAETLVKLFPKRITLSRALADAAAAKRRVQPVQVAA